jgi:hypothetical protein
MDRFESELLKAGRPVYRKKYPRGPRKGGVPKQLGDEAALIICQQVVRRFELHQKHFGREDVIRRLIHDFGPYETGQHKGALRSAAVARRVLNAFLFRKRYNEVPKALIDGRQPWKRGGGNAIIGECTIVYEDGHSVYAGWRPMVRTADGWYKSYEWEFQVVEPEGAPATDDPPERSEVN